MAQVTIETVAYPAWWSGATTVRVTFELPGGSGFTWDGPRSDVEMLPQGCSVPGRFHPWSHTASVEKLT